MASCNDPAPGALGTGLQNPESWLLLTGGMWQVLSLSTPVSSPED